MRALLIDADPMMVHAVTLMLRASGIAADCAASVQEALLLVHRRGYDVIVLDPRLQDAQGQPVLEQLHAASAAPVLALADDQPAPRRDSLGGVADDYIATPFDRVELTSRLNRLVRRGVAATKLTRPVQPEPV